MKINPVKFQKVFTLRAKQILQPEATGAPETSPATDSVELSKGPTGLDFQGAVTALATSATLGGVPALAALSQQVAQEITTPQEEVNAAAQLAEQLDSLPKVEEPRVTHLWSEVAEVTATPFDAPRVVDSFFIDAQADARNMYIGTTPLQNEMSTDEVLAFTLAHEEGHRQHRDTTGAAGLEALVALCEGDEKAYTFAFQALAEGRKQNEREADEFAARAVKKMGYESGSILEFLNALPGDLQHPPGEERARAVEAAMLHRETV